MQFLISTFFLALLLVLVAGGVLYDFPEDDGDGGDRDIFGGPSESERREEIEARMADRWQDQAADRSND